MKNKIITLFLVFTVLAASVACTPAARDAMKKCDRKSSLFLVAGFDDAAENTDVLFTVGYDPAINTAYVAQIPRDTYFNFGKGQNKINQIYATARAEGMSSDDAMKHTSKLISDAFGTSFDGYVAIGISTFRKIVDAIGGLDIELSEDMIISVDDTEQIVLKKGKNHISGEAAEAFVRFRSGYALGDLGRMDAQKIFLNSLFKKLSGGLTFPELFRVAKTFYGDVVTNIKISHALSLVSESLTSKIDRHSVYATVPGEAINYKNLSFYVLNRKSAAEISNRYMFADRELDPEKRFCNAGEDLFKDVYYDESIGIREYRDDNIEDINITPKRK